jgi:uncharacterized protein (TIGR02284 family)
MSEAVATPEQVVFSDLAHKLVDQVALYGLARDLARAPEIVEAIQRVKEARAQLLQEINAKLWVSDIAAIDQGANLGHARKAFTRMREIRNEDDASVLAEVERGELYLCERVSKAIQDERLGAHVINYLQTVLSRITTSCDEIRALKRIVL